MVLSVFPAVSTAQIPSAEPKLEIKPESYTAMYCEIFDINITISNVEAADMLVAVEFKLGFDPVLLEVIDITEGSFMKDPRWALEGTWFASKIEEDYVVVGILLLPHVDGPPAEWTAFPEGSGTLATVTFHCMGIGSCVLDLKDTKLVNPVPELINHTTADGFVENVRAPRIWIEPGITNIPPIDYVFGINVTIEHVEAADMLVAVEIKIRYNTTMLSVVNVTEGPFMKDPAWALDGTHFIGPRVEEDYVLFAILLLPHWDGEWCEGGEWCLTFPEGSGTLATVTFNVIAMGSCVLELFDTKLVDSEIRPINHTTGDGLVSVTKPPIPGPSPDVNGDGVVDIFDIVEAAIAFGSYPGHPRFKSVADLNLDNVIDIYDIVAIALEFSTYT